jgi:hypothetical protein
VCGCLPRNHSKSCCWKGLSDSRTRRRGSRRRAGQVWRSRRERHRSWDGQEGTAVARPSGSRRKDRRSWCRLGPAARSRRRTRRSGIRRLA